MQNEIELQMICYRFYQCDFIAIVVIWNLDLIVFEY